MIAKFGEMIKQTLQESSLLFFLLVSCSLTDCQGQPVAPLQSSVRRSVPAAGVLVVRRREEGGGERAVTSEEEEVVSGW